MLRTRGLDFEFAALALQGTAAPLREDACPSRAVAATTCMSGGGGGGCKRNRSSLRVLLLDVWIDRSPGGLGMGGTLRAPGELAAGLQPVQRPLQATKKASTQIKLAYEQPGGSRRSKATGCHTRLRPAGGATAASCLLPGSLLHSEGIYKVFGN